MSISSDPPYDMNKKVLLHTTQRQSKGKQVQKGNKERENVYKVVLIRISIVVIGPRAVPGGRSDRGRLGRSMECGYLDHLSAGVNLHHLLSPLSWRHVLMERPKTKVFMVVDINGCHGRRRG